MYKNVQVDMFILRLTESDSFVCDYYLQKRLRKSDEFAVRESSKECFQGIKI